MYQEPQTTQQLARLITTFIEGRGQFEELALQIFAYQYRNNIPYQNFCNGRGITPDIIDSWWEIPAAPAAAFKLFDLTSAPLTLCLPSAGGRLFQSSGTTGRESSRHYMDQSALDVYRAALRDGFHRFILPDRAELPLFALMLPPVQSIISETENSQIGMGAPHSSLSFMLGELITDYGGCFFAQTNWQTELASQLRQLTAPIVLFGTAFAFIHFFDAVSEQFSLPEGSRVVETGGFKGRSREVSRDELYQLFTERLGVPATFCVSEYGMSEMASQFYDSTLHDHVQRLSRPSRKISSPTVRTRLIDPVTGKDAEHGEVGLLTHYDLCNLNSVLALQTEDIGRAADDGEGFILLGRAPGAVLRGCSLTAEEWEESQKRAISST